MYFTSGSDRAFEQLMQTRPGADHFDSGEAGAPEDCGTCRFYRPHWKYQFCVYEECPYQPGKLTALDGAVKFQVKGVDDEMAVFRVEKNRGYTVMSNHHLRNKDLSLKAKGLLSQMLSLPESWDFTLKGLSLINREQIDAIRAAVRELEQAGYIVRSRERDSQGRLRGADYIIYEQPQPVPDSPTLENPTLDIVDAETWELAQKLRKTPRRHDTLGEANPLTGLVFCADCGAKMMNHRSRGGTENNPYPSDFYDCSTYTLAHQKRTHACSGHYIRSKVLRELILETIRAASTFAISDRDAFLEKVRSASQLRQAEAAKETKRKLNKEKKRISELDTIIKKLYESFAVGRITDERFDSLLAEYEAEQKALTASVSEMETQMSAFADDTDRAKQFLELARKYTDFSELTTPMINEFVEKIIVHAPEKIDGDRVQEVEIYLRFIGRFELPVTELTEEEIKRQEQLKRHRIKSRERYQKIKAGEHAVGQPFRLTCKCCGQEFASKRTNTLFCGPNCRAKFYRQEAAESRSRECTCENCSIVFTTTRSDVKYCSDDCRYQAQIKRQGARKKALREAKIEPALPEKETKSA